MFNTRKIEISVSVARQQPFTYISDGIRCLDDTAVFSWRCKVPKDFPAEAILSLVNFGNEFIREQVARWKEQTLVGD